MAKNSTQDKYLGSHEQFGREEEIKTSSDRSFGIVFAVFFAIVAALSWWADGRHWMYWLGASLVMLTVALAFPGILAPLNKLWTRFGLLLSAIISPIVLGIIFYLIVTPIGLIMRLFGKDILELKFRPDAKSYWIIRNSDDAEKHSFRNQF